METLSGFSQPSSTLTLNFVESPHPVSVDKSIELPSVRDFRAYQIRLPLTAVCLLSGLSLTLLSPPSVLPGSSLNYGLIITGALFMAAGLLMRLWSILYIQSRKSTSIVTTGPYALCRNPLYVGTLLIVIAYLFMVQSLTLALFTLPIIALYIWGVIPAEETVLLARHPEAYSAYCAAVPRWFPKFRWSAFQKAPFVWSKAVRRELECSFWWVGIAVLVCFVCSYRAASGWHHPLMWP